MSDLFYKEIEPRLFYVIANEPYDLVLFEFNADVEYVAILYKDRHLVINSNPLAYTQYIYSMDEIFNIAPSFANLLIKNIDCVKHMGRWDTLYIDMSHEEFRQKILSKMNKVDI